MSKVKTVRGICGACRKLKPLMDTENPPAKCRPCSQREELLGYNVMKRAMAALLKAWCPPAAYDGLVRVDGRATCGRCRLPYRDHPEIEPTFHIRCDGVMVKT